MEPDCSRRSELNKTELLKKILENKKAVIFDFDNVIVDSEPYHFEAYSTVFTEKGHTLDRKEYWLEWTSKGGGAEGEIKRHNLDLDPDEIRHEKDPIYSEFCRTGKIRIFPESPKIISAFKVAGYTLAIASGSYEHDIRAILSANDIETYFSTIVGKDAVTRYKPHPETYLNTSQKLGVQPRECLVIEDAEKGVRSARDAGMNVILIETQVTQGLALGGADLKFSCLEELSRILPEVLRQVPD
jgi:beta-phosphoglucomutase-like phosphatase (HAD superfamily)